MRWVACFAGFMVLNSLYALEPPVVSYDHLKGGDKSYTVAVPPGGFFQVEISNTCSAFKVEYVGVAAVAVTSPGSKTSSDLRMPWSEDCVIATEKTTLKIPHDAAFGGYIIKLTSPGGSSLNALLLRAGVTKDKAVEQYTKAYRSEWAVRKDDIDRTNKAEDAGLAAVGELKTLTNVVLVVAVRPSGWSYELAGGFTTSWLTDPVYGVEHRTEGGQDVQYLVRAEGSEDRYHLGFAGFIHLVPPPGRYDWLAASFGLGINTGNNVSFFVGPSVRLSGKAYITAGWNVGQVKTLPPGVAVGQKVSDANLLSNLPSKTAGAFFIGFSYSFLNPGEGVFKKPFATPASDTAKASMSQELGRNQR